MAPTTNVLLDCALRERDRFVIDGVVASCRDVNVYVGDRRQRGVQAVLLEDVWNRPTGGSGKRVLAVTIRRARHDDGEEPWPPTPTVYAPPSGRDVIARRWPPHTEATNSTTPSSTRTSAPQSPQAMS